MPAETLVLTPATATKAVVVEKQVEQDGAESDSTWSDFMEQDNGETSSDGDFTSCELSDEVLSSDCSDESVTLTAVQGDLETPVYGKVARKSVRFQEGAALVEEILFTVDETLDDEAAAEETSASEGLVSSISALLKLKAEGRDQEVVSQMDVPPAETATESQQQHLTNDIQRQQAAMHAQQLAQWQHAQLARRAYAAQMQAAQMQYAAHWQAAQMQYAAQLQAAHMHRTACAVNAAAPAKKTRK